MARAKISWARTSSNAIAGRPRRPALTRLRPAVVRRPAGDPTTSEHRRRVWKGAATASSSSVFHDCILLPDGRRAASNRSFSSTFTALAWQNNRLLIRPLRASPNFYLKLTEFCYGPHYPPLRYTQYRHHCPRRRRQDDDDGAHPVLHG